MSPDTVTVFQPTDAPLDVASTSWGSVALGPEELLPARRLTRNRFQYTYAVALGNTGRVPVTLAPTR